MAGCSARRQDEEEDAGRRQVALCAAKPKKPAERSQQREKRQKTNENKGKRGAPVVPQSSLVTRWPARHPPARERRLPHVLPPRPESPQRGRGKHSKFGRVGEQDGWRQEALIVMQSSSVTRRPTRHMPARERRLPPVLSPRLPEMEKEVISLLQFSLSLSLSLLLLVLLLFLLLVLVCPSRR